MAEDLEKKLKTIAVAITLLVTATGAWTSVVVRGVDIASNKEDIVTLKTSTAAANVNKNIALINTGSNYTVGASTSVLRIVTTYRIWDDLGL